MQAMKAGDTALSGGEYTAAVKFYSQVILRMSHWPLALQPHRRYATGVVGCADVRSRSLAALDEL